MSTNMEGARTSAMRVEAIASAAAIWEGVELPFWDADDRMFGVCEVLADTFGVTDLDNRKTEIWEEIRAAYIAENARATAMRIVNEQVTQYARPLRGDTDDFEFYLSLVFAGMAAGS